MTIYFILVAFIFLGNLAYRQNRLSKKQYCILLGVVFTLVTGLRGVDVGSDTTGYYLQFLKLKSMSSIVDVVNNGGGDKGYVLLVWGIGRFIGPFWVLALLASIIFYSAITRFVYEKSNSPCLSFLTLMAFNFFQFSMTGMRQTMALGMALFFLLEVYRERPNWLKAIVLILVGALLHLSCCIILPAIIFRNIKPIRQSTFALWSFALLAVVFIFKRTLISAFLNLPISRLQVYGELNNTGNAGVTTYAVLFLLFLWGIFWFGKYCQKYFHGQFDILLLTVGICLQSFVMLQSIMFRFAWYFLIVLIIYLPRIIEIAEDRTTQYMLKTGIYGGILYMYFGITISSAYVVPYRFCWE